MSYRDAYHTLVNDRTGVVVAENIPIEDVKQKYFKNIFKHNKYMPRLDIRPIRDKNLTSAALIFFLRLIENASKANIVGDERGKDNISCYTDIANGYLVDGKPMNYKTIARYFRCYLQANLLKKHKKKFYLNPRYATKFSLERPPEEILKVFPEAFNGVITFPRPRPHEIN